LGSTYEGTYQGLDCSLEARSCEPWFQRELADLDRLRKKIDRATACEDELGQISIKQPPPLILDVEHSEADSTEVIPGLKRRSDTRPGLGSNKKMQASTESRTSGLNAATSLSEQTTHYHSIMAEQKR
jgi:hypothetical protein